MSHQLIKNPPQVDTFYLPPKKQLNLLEVGDTVKFIFEDESGAERMWAIIKDINGDVLTCELDNEPVAIESIKLGDVFTAYRKQVINIQ